MAVACESLEETVRVSDTAAHEHLEVITTRNHCGGRFVGGAAAEGDCGIDLSHTLPTSGTARYTGGLSMMAFLRAYTWMRVGDLKGIEHAAKDAVVLAHIEGPKGYAHAAGSEASPPGRRHRTGRA